MSTKSGTNAVHGTGAFMVRDERLDSNSFSNNAQNIPKREFRVQDAGGSIGGPILRNRLFFFSSYHGLRNNNTSTSLMTVPTALERVGNFSQSVEAGRERQPHPGRIFDPFNVVQEGPDLYRRREFPNAIISNPDPFAVRMYGSTRCRTGRRPTNTTRTTSRRRRRSRLGGTAGTTASTSSGATFDLRQRRHLVRRSLQTASVRQGAVEWRRRRPGGQGSVLPARRLHRPHSDARSDLRYGLVASSPSASPATRRASRLPGVRRTGQSSSPNRFSDRHRREPQRIRRRGRRRQQLDRALDRHLRHEARGPSNHSFTGSLTKLRGRWMHKAGGEYRTCSRTTRPGTGLGRDAIALCAPGRQFPLRVRDGERRRGKPRVDERSTRRQCCRDAARHGRVVDPARRQRGAGVLAEVPRHLLPERLARVVEADSQPRFALGSAARTDRTLRPHVGVGLHRDELLRHSGSPRVPGVDGYSRNLWDTTYDNFGPRVGAAYR